MKRLILWLPLAIFLIFIVTVALRLSNPGDRTIASRLIGEPLPEFSLAAAVPTHRPLKSADFRSGRPRLLNVFASWCGPCKVEAPQLTELQRRGVPIDAIAVRDRPEDVAAFLAEHGDPFDRIGSDPQTRLHITLGSSGVPETFVIDGKGVIRHQHIGVIRPDDVETIVAAYEAAK